MVIVWSKQAQNELKKAYLYIAQDSLQNAIKIRDEIIALTIEIGQNSEKYSLDKYKINNDGSWRAFEKYHYRISYRVVKDEIRIVRFRHTSRTPLSY